MSCLLVISTLILIVAVTWYRKGNQHSKFYATIPGPPTLPLLGNVLDFKTTTDFIPFLQQMIKKHGKVFKCQVGPIYKFIVITDYKFIEYILSSTIILTKSVEYKYLESWLGTGLLTSHGSKWKKHRKILTPAFHFQILEQFIEVFESCGDVLVQKFKKEIGNSVDVFPYLKLCTLDIICESIMGTAVNAQMDGSSSYVQNVEKIGKLIMERTISAIRRNDFLYPLTTSYYAEKNSIKILHDHTNEVIRRRRVELQKKGEFSEKKKPFLDILIQAEIEGKPLTDTEIREEVDTFMFEGHDTTTSALSFTLYCLANHPHAQQKVFEEQLCLFECEQNPKVSYSHLMQMKYLEMVIKESLRLYPSVPGFSREITKEFEYGGKTWPQGATLMIYTYGIHRDGDYFANPDDFVPERFEHIDGKLPYAYVPFSAGPRNCIGQKFAMLEMKSIISKLMRNYELEPGIPEDKPVLSSEMILQSRNGIKISFKRRLYNVVQNIS